MTATWKDTDYGYRKKITVSGALVSGSLNNFTALVCVTDSDLTKCESTGYDIRFYDSGQNKYLNHELISFDNSDGHLVAWVKLPVISSNVLCTGNTFYMYYDYTSALNSSSASGSWDSGYVAIYHMTGTSDAKGLYNLSGQNPPTVVDNGKVGQCYHFRHSSNEEYLCNDTLLDNSENGLDPHECTIECWIKPSSVSSRIFSISKTNTGPSSRNQIKLYFNWADENLKAVGYFEGGVEGTRYVYHPNVLTDKVWSYAAGRAVVDEHVYTFHNDCWASSESIFSNDFGAGSYTNFEIGREGFDNSGYCKGWMDEVRISNVKRSDDWLFTSWSTVENSGATGPFLYFHAEEEKPGEEEEEVAIGKTYIIKTDKKFYINPVAGSRLTITGG